MFWNCQHFSFDTRLPVIMGIINATPDSFSDGGKNFDAGTAVQNAKELVAQGAQIIDVGGESTRPGSSAIDPQVEWSRISEIVKELASCNICVSVDTRHAEVAEKALDAGACIINDISGFTDSAMVDVATRSGCGLVVMHMRGTPQTMTEMTEYEDVVGEVYAWLKNQTATLERAGIGKNRICVDPGPGFAKTPEQTKELMQNLHVIRHLGYPVMAAPSRKRYLKLLGDANLDYLTATECLRASELGAGVLRVHNVEAVADELEKLRPLVVLGLGANVPIYSKDESEREECLKSQLNMAITELLQLPDTELIDVSPFYKSEPAYYENQDYFLNCVVSLRCGIPPLELLKYLHVIEESLGRVREIDKGPRTIDIDIEDYQMYVCESDELTLPHLNLCERDFVVKPFSDILPNHILADGTPMNKVPEDERIGLAARI